MRFNHRRVKTPPTSAHPDSISGLVERVTFHNEENGFAVLKVKAKGHRDLITVVGALPAVSAGEWLTAQGRWMQDREFGPQFKAELLKSTAPTTREGIEKYLGSGMVKGIGPIYAKKLVDKFGEQIFEVIEQRSGELQNVEGIGPKRRQIIKAAWAEQKVIRQIMVFLHSQGVSTSRAVRIYKTYGEEAVERVRANPYALAADIHGIGFKTADEIAQRIGIPFDSLLRACAGLSHVLAEAMGDGHCALPTTLLREHAGQLLGVDEKIVDAALAKNIAEGQLARETFDGEELIFLPAIQRAEAHIAERMRALAAGPPTYPPIDFEKAAAWCQEKTGKELAPSQRDALRQALHSRLLIITGGPGVGKTTLLNAILKILRAKKIRCLLSAPTGRAAKRLAEATGLEARTLHRLLEAQPGGRFGRNESNLLECDLLVIDETSMVDVPLFSRLLRALPQSSALLLVGDVDQLPSVGPGMVLANLIESRIAPTVRLTEVFRQAAGSLIITNAHHINRGHLPEPSGEPDSDFHFIERDEPDRIADTLIEVVKHRIAAKFALDPIRDVQVLCPMHRGSLGVREMNLRLQDELNPARPSDPFVEKFGWQFRLRDKVIQTQNDYDKDVFNGDIGQITKIDPDERVLTVRFEGRDVSYDYGELDELSLAYAITIHKSQGSEFPAIVIPVATQQYMLLQRNLIYTGVTRGKKLVVLIGQRKALSLAVRNNHTQNRYSALLPRLTHPEK
ncbi:MAG TPA: ATP-dependent RecD-like DNA helicase [Verrucomicrobiae bacterium]|jgi:exodeoxyribonuclease V alpha subunit|nr:ATP-dependent RecD-like DNA helicase [Verrucomicrobiae bacterium]